MKYVLQTKVWMWDGPAAWHFATVHKALAAEIRAKHASKKRGFGSIRVKAKIGKTAWDTSIFPEKRTETYLLPVKTSVRRAEGIDAGDTVEVTLLI